jgi:glyoxylase-like metal-dependent hydrolase (beta-lactamase superfamily II)
MAHIKIHPIKIDFKIPVSDQLKLSRFVYLFIIEGEALHLIDSGVASAFEPIYDYSKKIGRDIYDIQNIFLTHSHPDHIGAAKIIQDKTNCKVYAPEKEVHWIENTDLQFKQRPVPGFKELVAGSVKVYRTVQQEQEFKLEQNLTLRAVPTPGHSCGSTSYYFNEAKSLFCGDAVLLPGEIPIFDNVQQYQQSLENIKKLQTNVLYSSWDQQRFTSEIPEILESGKNYILQIQQVAKEVAFNFKNVNSLEYCAAVLKRLNQNPGIANPLLLKSFLACLI